MKSYFLDKQNSIKNDENKYRKCSIGKRIVERAQLVKTFGIYGKSLAKRYSRFEHIRSIDYQNDRYCPLFFTDMAVVWEKLPLFSTKVTVMAVINHLNYRYLKLKPKWPLFINSINSRSSWWRMISKWPIFSEKTTKVTVIYFNNLNGHFGRWNDR